MGGGGGTVGRGWGGAVEVLSAVMKARRREEAVEVGVLAAVVEEGRVVS